MIPLNQQIKPYKGKKRKVLINYLYEYYPFTTASYLDMAVKRRDDLILLHAEDLKHDVPDYIINVEPVARILSCAGVPSCYWEIDNHVINGADQHFYGDVDIVLLAQKLFGPQYEPYRNDWVPLGADPTVHKPFANEPVLYDVGLIGNDTYPERRKLLERIKTKYNVLTGQADPGEPYARALCSCKIVFNKSMNLDVNMRVFEALSCGRLLLTDVIPTQDELLIEGEHYVGYNSGDELMDKLDYYLSNPAEAEKIAQAGMNFVHTNHTYDLRLCQILKIMDNLKSQ